MRDVGRATGTSGENLTSCDATEVKLTSNNPILLENPEKRQTLESASNVWVEAQSIVYTVATAHFEVGLLHATSCTASSQEGCPDHEIPEFFQDLRGFMHP